MKQFRIALFSLLMACCASAGWAQYGLYGAPEMLPVPQPAASQNQAVLASYAQPASVPAAAQSGSAAAYDPPPQAYYPPVSYYPQTTAMYQPSQAGAQYRYPAPGATGGAAATRALAPTPSGQNGYGSIMGGCGGCGTSCEDNGYQPCLEGTFCPWYGSLTALVMGRSDARRVWTSYDSSDETNQLTNTQFGSRWGWGGEVRVGRRFCCCCVPYAVEATYWTTEDLTGLQSTTNPTPGGTVSTPLVIQPMLFGATSAENWFDGAAEHRLWRRDEFHNLEINLLREQLACGCNSPWDVGWSVGVRYFRFEESLKFGSLMNGYNWGDNDGACEAYLSDRTANNLVGVQCGFDAAYNLVPGCHGVRLFVSPKVGLYGNCIDQTFEAHTGDGIDGTGPYGSFPVHSTRSGVSFLTQIDVGADWQFARNWSLRGGYRVMAITGMALADDQFPQYMVDIPAIADIQHYGSLVLHGAFVGVTYCF
jgi:hypothetical protein